MLQSAYRTFCRLINFNFVINPNIFNCNYKMLIKIAMKNNYNMCYIYSTI